MAVAVSVLMVWLARSRHDRQAIDTIGGLAGAVTNTLLVAVTGGHDSPFLPLFGVGPVIGAAVPLRRWQIAFNVGLATVGLLSPYVYQQPPDGFALRAAGHVALWTIAATAVYLVVARLERHQRQLEEADRLRTLFLRAISHELRTPLSVIRGTSQTLLARDAALPAGRRIELLTALDRQSERLDRLLGDLLDLDRLERGSSVLHTGTVDLAALVRGVAEMVQAPRHLLETGHLATVTAVADRAKLERVVENLVANAVKHTPPGTRVRLSSAAVGAHAQIVVEDDGPGIPTRLHPTIFEPFVQGVEQAAGARPGTGIGLSLVRELVALHGGRITLDRSPDLAGARFTVDLPRPAEPDTWSARRRRSEGRPVRPSSSNGLVRRTASTSTEAQQETSLPDGQRSPSSDPADDRHPGPGSYRSAVADGGLLQCFGSPTCQPGGVRRSRPCRAAADHVWRGVRPDEAQLRRRPRGVRRPRRERSGQGFPSLTCPQRECQFFGVTELA